MDGWFSHYSGKNANSFQLLFISCFIFKVLTTFFLSYFTLSFLVVFPPVVIVCPTLIGSICVLLPSLSCMCPSPCVCQLMVLPRVLFSWQLLLLTVLEFRSLFSCLGLLPWILYFLHVPCWNCFCLPELLSSLLTSTSLDIL